MAQELFPVQCYAQFYPSPSIIDSPRSPSITEVLDSPRSPSITEVLDSPRSPSITEVLDSPRSPSITEVLDSPRSPSLIEVLDSPRSPSITEVLDSPRCPSIEELDFPKSPSIIEVLGSPRSSSDTEIYDSSPREYSKLNDIMIMLKVAVSTLNSGAESLKLIADMLKNLSQTMPGKKEEEDEKKINDLKEFLLEIFENVTEQI